MTAPFYFISYSRSQLYFAESAAVELERMGVDVWFDLQQLKTGEDWASEIKRGLDECAGVVLIVSQRSLASKYVELEWKAALDAGKPVYLLYFEPAELTDERLNSCPSVDGRGRFKPAIRQLARAITQGERPQEAARFRTVRPPKRLARILAADDDGAMRFPTKLSPGVLVITLSMFGISGALLMAMLMAWMIFGIAFSLWLAAMTGYGLLASSHYVRRKLVGEPPRFFVLVSLLGAFAMLAMFQPFPGQQRTMAILAVTVALMTALFVLAYVLRGGDVLRWTLTGFAGERRRRRYHGGRWLRRAGTGNHSVSYRVMYSRGDEKFAARLNKAMQKYGHVPAADDTARDDTFDFFLVSNLTVWDEVRAAVETHPRLIAAAMTSVKLPDDVYQTIGRFQYLDARTDAKRRFEVMAASLTEKEVQSNSLSASLETTPANLDLTVIPRRVQAGLGMLRLYATAGLLAPILVVLQFLTDRTAISELNLSMPALFLSLTFSLMFALFCFGLDHLARSRQITTRTFMLLYAAGMSIYMTVSSALGGVQILNDSQQNFWVIFLSIAIVLVTSAGLFAWLPAVQPRKLSFEGVRAEGRGIVRDVAMISAAASYATFAIFPVLLFGGIGALQSVGMTYNSGSQTSPVFYSSTTRGNLTVRFPAGMRVMWLSAGKIDASRTSDDPAVVAAIQQFIDDAAPNLGDSFMPTYAAYGVGDENGALTLMGGQFAVQAEDARADYARQLLEEQIDGLRLLDANAVYDADYQFGAGADGVPGALATLSVTGEDGEPMQVRFAAIDTATAHHMIYTVNTTDTPMQTLIDQFFALIAAAG